MSHSDSQDSNPLSAGCWSSGTASATFGGNPGRSTAVFINLAPVHRMLIFGSLSLGILAAPIKALSGMTSDNSRPGANSINSKALPGVTISKVQANITPTREASKPRASTEVVTSKSDRSFYQLKLETLDGKPISLTDYQDYTLLVVNTASRCGFTPQLTQLNELKQKYKNKKFEIFAFPSNDFRQEHTESKAIAARASEFGEPQYVMMAPTKVTGPNTSPLFQMLKQQSSLVPQEIQWNFEKFIIAPGGKVVGHFRSRIAPTDPQIIAIINLHLD